MIDRATRIKRNMDLQARLIELLDDELIKGLSEDEILGAVNCATEMWLRMVQSHACIGVIERAGGRHDD